MMMSARPCPLRAHLIHRRLRPRVCVYRQHRRPLRRQLILVRRIPGLLLLWSRGPQLLAGGAGQVGGLGKSQEVDLGGAGGRGEGRLQGQCEGDLSKCNEGRL